MLKQQTSDCPPPPFKKQNAGGGRKKCWNSKHKIPPPPQLKKMSWEVTEEKETKIFKYSEQKTPQSKKNMGGGSHPPHTLPKTNKIREVDPPSKKPHEVDPQFFFLNAGGGQKSF